MAEVITTLGGRTFVTIDGVQAHEVPSEGAEMARAYDHAYGLAGLVPDERERVLPRSASEELWARWSAQIGLGLPEVGR